MLPVFLVDEEALREDWATRFDVPQHGNLVRCVLDFTGWEGGHKARVEMSHER